ERQGTPEGVNPAAVGRAGVARDGAAVQRHDAEIAGQSPTSEGGVSSDPAGFEMDCAEDVVNAASQVVGGVAGDRAVVQREHPGVQDTAAAGAGVGGVSGDNAPIDR